MRLLYKIFFRIYQIKSGLGLRGFRNSKIACLTKCEKEGSGSERFENSDVNLQHCIAHKVPLKISVQLN